MKKCQNPEIFYISIKSKWSLSTKQKKVLPEKFFSSQPVALDLVWRGQTSLDLLAIPMDKLYKSLELDKGQGRHKMLEIVDNKTFFFW